MKHQANNFTALRWLGALMVLVGHSFIFLGLPEPVVLGWAPLGPIGVYIFFSISGYLVAQSWDRDPHVGRFLLRRVLRIFPGLWICILLSAYVLGPLVTQIPLADYWVHAHTKAYLSNLYLYISYALPGVFAGNAYPHAVNGSLWSLPIEFMMYLFMVALLWLRPSRMISLAVGVLAVLMAVCWAMSRSEMLVFYRSDMRQLFICGAYFWSGVLIHQWQLSARTTSRWLLGLVTCWAALYPWRDLFVLISYVVLPLLIIVVGEKSWPGLRDMNAHDYSYGIYIYAFPIQQTIAYLYPTANLASYLALTVTLTLLLAKCSWQLIERPSLRFKPKVQPSVA
jgi:peptidoglycan/LPS O-acetylase OafA/YrhL